MPAKLVTYNSQNYAGTLGSGLIIIYLYNVCAGNYQCFEHCRPYDVKCIEFDSHSSIYTMFVHAGNYQCNDEFKTVWSSSSNLCRN